MTTHQKGVADNAGELAGNQNSHVIINPRIHAAAMHSASRVCQRVEESRARRSRAEMASVMGGT